MASKGGAASGATTSGDMQALIFSVKQLVLAQPDYVQWLLSRVDLKGRAATVHAKICKQLLPGFDRKPLTERCNQCGRRAVYGTGCINNSRLLYWWCDECYPYSTGQLFEIRTYRHALHFAELCGVAGLITAT